MTLVRIYSRSLYLELFHQTLPCVYNLFACSTSIKLSIGRQQSSNYITYIDQYLRLQRHNAIWMDPAESNTSISILLQVPRDVPASCLWESHHKLTRTRVVLATCFSTNSRMLRLFSSIINWNLTQPKSLTPSQHQS